MRRNPGLEKLYATPAACVDINTNLVEFEGRYDECLIYLRKNIKRVKTDELRLHSVAAKEGGFLEIGHLLSFVL